MKPTAWQRLDHSLRHSAPLLLTLALVMLGMLPYGIPGLAPVMPWLALAAVYYWSLHRPDLLPAVAVFAVGLFHDLLAGSALGVGVLVLLGVHALIVGQRRVFRSQSFAVVWLGFGLVAAGAFALVWALNAVLLDRLLDPSPAAFQYLTTVAVYPLVAGLFARVQRGVPRAAPRAM